MGQHAFGPARTMRDNFMGDSEFDSISHSELARSIADSHIYQKM